MNDSVRPDRNDDRDWERRVLENVATAAVVEQRRARRWGVFFRFVGFAFLFGLLAATLGWLRPAELALPGRHTALVKLRGVIAPGAEASADRVIEGLRRAFGDPDTADVILRVNSPGGSAVQADIISDEIRQLREAHPKVPIYAVV